MSLYKIMHLGLDAFNTAYVKRERNVYYVELSALSAQDSGNTLNQFMEKGKGFLLTALTVVTLSNSFYFSVFLSLLTFFF